ncbi:MAG: DUF3102 domain-containing protein [Clostridia bacterium]|nr:DUF3102 domain-containing protein [Clostridia bacterium]
MNESTNIIETQNVRDIDVVTSEIKNLVAQAQCLLLTYSIEIGRRLHEAKSLLPHGEWGNWLKEKVGFSQSSANNHMKIFEEYGAEQITLFGAVPNSQTLGNLPYTKALKLLAIPSDEREDFVKENNIEDMSSRELEQAIRERNEARAAAEKAEAEKAEIQELLNEAQEYQEAAREAEAELHKLKDSTGKLQADLAKAKAAEKKAKEALKNLQENPEIPDSVTEKIKAEAEAEAAAMHKSELEKTIAEANRKIDEAMQKKKAAESSAGEMQHKYDELLKKQKMNNPDVMSFKVYFEQAQDIYNKLSSLLGKIKENDAETAKGLTEALHKLGEMYEKT